MTQLSTPQDEAGFSRPTYFTAELEASRATDAVPVDPVAPIPAVEPVPRQAQRVEVPTRGWFHAFATWLGRTVYLLLFVAAMGLAAAAAVHAWDLRGQAADDQQRIDSLEAQVAALGGTNETARNDLTESKLKLGKLEADLDASRAREEQSASEAEAYRKAMLQEQARAVAPGAASADA